MKVHNLMEEIVTETVSDLFDDEEKEHRQGFCTCYQCRIDVVCYVLNRIKPQYMLSGRGLAHLKSDYKNNLQKMADLMGLVNDAIKKVDATKRPHFAHQGDHEQALPVGPLFNFPTIMGKIVNGSNFEPLSDVSVSLKSKGSLVRMINPNWQNPCPISEKTAGTFLFWPYPAQAQSLSEKKVIEFEISTERSQFEEMHYFFTLELSAESEFNYSIGIQKTFEVEALYLFPR